MLYILLTAQISLSDQISLPLLLEMLGTMYIAIVYYQGCDVIDFKVNVIFLIESFFLHDQNLMTKTLLS